MREIKFRQWDSVHNRMEYGAGAKKPSGWVGFSNVSWDRYPIMQYIGRKDKNGGVEIYEGDILDWFGSRYVVEWSNSDAGFKRVNSISKRKYNFDVHVETTDKVIGNIYEHPELLNDKEE